MTATQYLFGFNGRINRAKWWLLILIQIGAAFVYYVAVLMLAGTSVLSFAGSLSKGESGLGALGGSAFLLMLLSLGYCVGMFIAWLAVTIKRLHDRDKSGAWILLFAAGPWVMYVLSLVLAVEGSSSLSGLLALAGFGISVWAFIELGCLRGTVGENRFGPDPFAMFYPFPAQQAPSNSMPVARPAEPGFPNVGNNSTSAIELSGVDRFSDYYLKIDALELGGLAQGLEIGRDPDPCAFVIDDESISRIHARLSTREGDFVLQDVDSTNGTKLNGRALAKNELARLHSGDLIALGAASFKVQIG